jgi:hypothetical protein
MTIVHALRKKKEKRRKKKPLQLRHYCTALNDTQYDNTACAVEKKGKKKKKEAAVAAALLKGKVENVIRLVH